MNIKDLPIEERPVERMMTMGPKKLSNAELIALVLRTGMGEESAIGLAERLISTFDGGIKSIQETAPQELMGIRGIGRSKACAIAAVGELSIRLSKPNIRERLSISSAGDVAEIFMQELRGEKREHFNSILLDTKGRIIHIDEISIGDMSMAPVHPREVFNNAIKRSAASIILVHNHPSGDPSPSSEDERITERLVEAGKLVGIKVLDHIIIGDSDYYSFSGMGLIED